MLEDESEWEDGAILTPKARRSVRHERPPAIQPFFSGSPTRPPPINIPILSSRSSECDCSFVPGCETAFAASTQSAASHKRKRDRNPAKTLAPLKLLNKPVRYISDEDKVRESIPDGVGELWADVRKLCKGNGYIPKMARAVLLLDIFRRCMILQRYTGSFDGSEEKQSGNTC
ncbi:hypothetical protein DM02DRAFT_662406 [Periconia macrospinosa]|uniref:Uncharacterized protein n=1 Tax=Periconia macrospinosa TaxID=97972 RepID=A0A2V1D4Q9_9PLEO|nr:hypothetical protein DM02DRAFT_662406 [Periconia macrospinosa]